jgi:hypothetical protein
MAHTAESLFAQNIASAEECLQLYDGVSALRTSLHTGWVLRAAIVFAVSALDTYYHDKVRYRVGRFAIDALPDALAKFQIPLGDLSYWDEYQRKGNLVRWWVNKHLSTRPLQSPNAIADALKLAGITAYWDTIGKDKAGKRVLFEDLNQLIKRRNQIAHEGDRETSRKSGKKLRPIDRSEAVHAIDLAKSIVEKTENEFPG